MTRQEALAVAKRLDHLAVQVRLDQPAGRVVRWVMVKQAYGTLGDLMEYMSREIDDAFKAGRLEVRDTRRRLLNDRAIYNWGARTPLTMKILPAV